MSASAPTAPRSYSTRELQAAAAALAAGRFCTNGSGRADRPVLQEAGTAECSTAERNTALPANPEVAAMPTAATHGTRMPTSAVSGLAALVRVRPATAGAGASTVALAIADAAGSAGLRARVLDAAAPAWSGLLAATVTELGAADGWRRGRRSSNVLIDRAEDPVQAPGEVPVPRQIDGFDLTVLDAGWSMRELTAAPGAWLTSTPARAEVLVARLHGLALSQTEAALADLEEQLTAERLTVVIVGATRWSDREVVTAGRLLRRAHEQGAMVFMPLLPAKARPGLGPEPLPMQLTKPARRLLERITTITGPLTANRT